MIGGDYILETKDYELFQGDCLELMKNIPDKSVNMILCDLPYGTTNCKWDSIIPFDDLWIQYKRIIKDEGAICLFGSEPFSSKLRLSNIEMYKYDWIWDKRKSSSALNCNYQPLKTHEIISVFGKMATTYSKNGNMKYNPQGIVPCKKINKRNSHKADIFHSNPNFPTLQKYTNYPKSILNYSNEGGFHPTQKPINLLEYLIKTYTNENEIILDNCMGSGSTGVACMNTNRKFIGIELERNYFEIAENRIKEAG